MSDRIDLGSLTARHIGSTVTIAHQGTTIRGQLTGFQIDTDWISETTYAQHPDDAEQVPGRRTVSLTVGPWSTDRLPLNTTVEVQA